MLWSSVGVMLLKGSKFSVKQRVPSFLPTVTFLWQDMARCSDEMEEDPTWHPVPMSFKTCLSFRSLI